MFLGCAEVKILSNGKRNNGAVLILCAGCVIMYKEKSVSDAMRRRGRGCDMESYLLDDYLSALTEAGLLVDAQDVSRELFNHPIRHLSCDTRDMAADTLFVCKGAHFRPEYAEQAARGGAVAYVSQTDYRASIPAILVSDVRAAMALLAKLFYGAPSDKLMTVGVTGTKGKSTTVYYLKAILDQYLNKECAVLSSIDNYDGVIREESHLTTPEPIMLHRHFRNAVDSGISHLVMEVSSQALKYGRVAGVTYTVGVFHNIGLDHISPIEHPDFEDYFAAKMEIFSHCGIACIHLDIPQADELIARAKEKGCRIVTYGERADAVVRCSDVTKIAEGYRFTVTAPDGSCEMQLGMPGRFNVQNAMAAVASLWSMGIPLSACADGLKTARVSGRMEVFTSADQRVTVLVDYAHNDMSFHALFDSVDQEYPGKKKIAVFGCPGKKAFLRREDLGRIAGQRGDYVVITEEDSGEEPFDSIAADIARHVEAAGCAYSVSEDRGEAIREAILEHGTDKVILLTGKGRETRMKRGLLYIDTPSDVAYTEKYLAEYDARVKIEV